jgi:hypothetical protein
LKNLSYSSFGNKKDGEFSMQYCTKKSNALYITITDFKLYYKAITMKTTCYLHKVRYEDQWNRMKDPDMSPYSYAHQILIKVPKTFNGEKIASSTNFAGKSGYLPAEN